MHDQPHTTPSLSEIQRTAHAWVIRLTSGSVQPSDVAAARAWCEQAPEHQQAFVEARRMWSLSAHLAQPAASAQPSARRLWAMGIAASLVLGLGVTWAQRMALDADYYTGTGERRQVVLADGSQITLNANSAVDVKFTDDGRRITLRKGEAVFDVKPDPQRPFSVQAGALSATALGTIYAVRRDAEHVDVTVRRGRVAVTGEPDKVTLGAGETVGGRADGLGAKQRVDVDTMLAWEQGRLVFELTPLAQVLEQLERYRPGIIVLRDSRLGALKVSGTFQLNDLDEGLTTLENVFALKIERYTDYLLVISSKT
ncbi:FecR family protein [Pseudomonas sp. WS 5111]|jgi:transmembrane sensor|uniref:FecR family protein n=1 Tax=unclassified Pseudomonas TaxID=196821 RepID=UPI001473B84A|nr:MULTISPECIES: FecR family protein [unclassified Pseudomonas]NMX66108.1 FecR family protein [Pseudomonas sp. WS 5111]NMX85443.1 FecR family protein [Pseudomonas sp. WS 5010]